MVAFGGGRIGAVALLALASAGCAHHRVPLGGETITYSYSSSPLCSRSCSNYTVTLGPDGQGILVPHGGAEQRFAASPEQAAAFAAALRPYRPSGLRRLEYGHECRVFATDGDQLSVRWTNAAGLPAELVFNTGCDFAKNRAMLAAFRAAPQVLLIADRLGGDRPAPARR